MLFRSRLTIVLLRKTCIQNLPRQYFIKILALESPLWGYAIDSIDVTVKDNVGMNPRDEWQARPTRAWHFRHCKMVLFVMSSWYA